LTGLLLGRKAGGSGGGVNLRKLTNGNARWMSDKERAVAGALAAAGKGHVFRAWPPPGVNDGAKRAVLAAAGAALEGAAGGAELEAARQSVLVPPVAPRERKVLEAHGDARVDEYYWLRDDARKDPRVLEHLAKENEYTRAMLADTEALQEALYREMRGRIKEEDQSVPERSHGYYYYTRTGEGQQYKVHCRRAVPPGAGAPTERDTLDEAQPEEVLLDENRRKEEGRHTFYMVGGAEPSPNHKLYAWSEDTVGGEKFTLHVKDLATGAEVMAPLPGTSGDIEWGADNATLFYVVKDHLDRPYKVLRHTIGRPAAEDVVVFEEKDESFYVGIHKSRSEAVIFISAGSAVTSEVWYVRADAPGDAPRVILPRVQDVEYSVSHRGSHFYITLRDQGRPNSELRVAHMDKPEAQTVLLPHSRDVKLEHVSLSAHYLAVFERSGGLQRVRVYGLPAGNGAPTAALDPATATEVAFEEPAYSMGGGGLGDFDSPVLRLHYSSLTTPSSVIDYHMGTGARATKKVAPVLGGFAASDYVTQRTWATAPDGVQVPVSFVYRKGVAKLDGSDPLLLNGYGSYEISNDAYFSSSRLCLLDRGWVFAIAHIRGGGEMGRYWYEDGKYLKKKNTFTDFIAAAEHLVSQRLTRPDRLCIEGRSAGGLLMGAVVNMRPDLFAASIMGVPFVDALTTMLDETIPLTIIEWEEWGNPKTKEFYDYMKSYSPVDNVRPGVVYPHILATGGLHDPRVGYWEPAKLVAKLRGARDPGSPPRALLLKMELGAGHFSVTGRFERLKEVAFEYAFLLKVQGMLGVSPVPGSATQPVAPAKL